VNNAVLVLNQNYEPLNVCNVRRALVLVIGGRAEILEAHTQGVTSVSAVFPAPSVIRLMYMIRRPRPRVKLTRREIFIRDGYTCQYCDHKASDLTIDHVIPRSRGGLHVWDNVVSACKPCNHRKGGKSIAEARMTLRTQPFEPRAGRYYTIERRLDTSVMADWDKFLPGISAAAGSRSFSSSKRSTSPA
jgi:5-methylcytosine-specific restriction endonuclease McrA